jgi:antitoxin component YwqK of YwqJK toxin-antitoxin module
MKRLFFLFSTLICLWMSTGCQTNRYPNDVVYETYVHRYGVELPAEDWSSRGQHGRVVSTRRDGVVVSKTYEAGILHGEVSYSFPHRECIQKKEIYDQGNLIQETYYYASGMPAQQKDYLSPETYSTISWYEGGVPRSKETFSQEGLVHGEYYDLSNQQESCVLEGVGKRIVRNDYGLLQSTDDIQNGQMTMRTTYYPDGKPAAHIPYVNGVIEGEKRTYTMGGEPATIEQWTNNCQHGNTIIFENGEKCADLPYVDGRPHGVECRYRDGGHQVVQRTTWVAGRKHGPCHHYVGSTVQTDWYFKDRLVNKPTYDMLNNQ